MQPSESLHEVIDPVDTSDATGYCMVPSSFTPNQKEFYWHWETKVATPRLQELGYKVLGWFDGERDSFGPLIRYVTVVKDGVKSELWYG
jgi:hypothetical protein